MGLKVLSFSNSFFTKSIFVGKPSFETHSISISSGAPSSSPSATCTDSYLIKRELGVTFKSSNKVFFQSRSS
jgi:hypothetical protein